MVPCLMIDSWFYGSWVLTPWNALTYNASTSNLAHHGLHWRFTHLLVNFPLLFSSLAFSCASISFHTTVFGRQRTMTWRSQDHKNNRHSLAKQQQQQQHRAEDLLLLSCIASGLFLLSLAPHQVGGSVIPPFPTLIFTQSLHTPKLNFTIDTGTTFFTAFIGAFSPSNFILSI